ncbi:MAG: hypothetical protein H6962_06460 [Chromatiaceae bacterium]|nr:hypothetical protein [Chromatiaceae bacterium]
MLGVRYLPVDEMLDRIRAVRATDPAGSAAVVPHQTAADETRSPPVRLPAEPPVVVLADTQAPSRTVIEPAVETAAEPLSQAEVVFEPDVEPSRQVAAVVEHLPPKIRATAVAAVAAAPVKTEAVVSQPVQATPNAPDLEALAAANAVAAAPAAPTPLAPASAAPKPITPSPVVLESAIPETVARKPLEPEPLHQDLLRRNLSHRSRRLPPVHPRWWRVLAGRCLPRWCVRPPSQCPVKPGMRVLVEADVGERSGLGKFTAESYATLLKGELETVSSDFLGGAAVQRGAPNLAFRDRLSDGRPGIEQLCEQVQVQRVLLADVSILRWVLIGGQCVLARGQFHRNQLR